MQLPDFDHARCKWDDWRAPHRVHANNFVQFDTGELIATQYYCRDRYYRGHLKTDLGLEVLASDELLRGSFTRKQRALKTPDGDKVLQSWFQSGEGFVFDVGAQMLVRTGDLMNVEHVPTRFRQRATAYWTGPNNAPIGAPLKLTKPRQRTAEEKELVNDMRALAKAWHRLDDEAKIWQNVYNKKGLSIEYLCSIEGNFEKLGVSEKARLAQNGVYGPFETITLPYVRVENV